MAILTTRSVVEDGLTPTYASVGASGDKVKPGDRTFIHVKNDSGGSVTVTVDDTQTREPAGAYQFDPNLHVVIAPSGESMIGPLPASRFYGADGYADVTYSASVSVTIAALRI